MTRSPKWPALALGVLGLLTSPDVRQLLESTMLLHMGVQIPLLFLCGYACVVPWRVALARQIAAWNIVGLTGLVFASLVLVVWMIPRSLDAAVTLDGVDALKYVSVVFAGTAFCLSWQRAPVFVQGFFAGNTVWMTCVVGLLYQEAPDRLCNAYLSGDQMRTGQLLVVLPLVLGLWWVALQFKSTVTRRRCAGQTGHL